MASRVAAEEEENWDDDFEFTPSPRHSPIPAIAPIHTFSHHHATRSNVGGSSSKGTLPPPLAPYHQQQQQQQPYQHQPQQYQHQPVNSYRSNPDLHTQRSNSALPRYTTTTTTTTTTAQGSQQSHYQQHYQQEQQQPQQQSNYQQQQSSQQYKLPPPVQRLQQSHQPPLQSQRLFRQFQQGMQQTHQPPLQSQRLFEQFHQPPQQSQQLVERVHQPPQQSQQLVERFQQQLSENPHSEAVLSTAAQAVRKTRYSAGSEEDWDMDEPTISQPPPTKPPTPLPNNSMDNPQPHPSLSGQHTGNSGNTGGHNTGNISPTMSAFSIPLSIDSSLRNHPSGSHGYGGGGGGGGGGGHHHHRDHSLTGHSITGAPSIAGHSIGGSSTNFLLHTGRRSVLEMEKGRQQQDRERRRLRKKSRPSPGSLPMPMGDNTAGGDDEDAFDVYGRASGKRYAIPAGMRGGGGSGRGDGDDSSIEKGSSGEDELSELEEEPTAGGGARLPPVPTASTSAPIPTVPSPLIKAPSRLLNLALNPTTKSHDRLTNPSSAHPTSSAYTSNSGYAPNSVAPSTPPVSSSASRAAGIGSRSTMVMTVPATSQPHGQGQGHAGHGRSSGQGHSTTQGHGHSTPHGPSKLVRKVSGTNVLTKSSPHMRGNAILAKHPPSSAAPPSSSANRPHHQDTPHAQLSKPHDAPVTKVHDDDDGITPQQSHIAQHPYATQQQQHPAHTYPASPPHRSKALDDCGTSIAPSTASHKEKRQSMLSRLGSLKRWGHTSGSPSTSGSNLPTSTSTSATPHSGAASHSRSGLGMLGSGLGLGRPGRESVSPRVFSSRLPAFLGGSKVDLHDRSATAAGVAGEHKVGSDASLARSPGRKYGLLRKPSLVLSNASSSALARVPSGDGEDGEMGVVVAVGRKESKEEHSKRGINPFRRVSIQGVKRLVGDHHYHQQQQQNESLSTTPAGTPEKEKKCDKDVTAGGRHHHHRTISFSALARGKLGVGASVEKSSKQKEAPASGRKSTDGRESSSATTVSHANSSVPHTLGRTAALAKAPKPPLKPLSPTSFGSSADAMAPPNYPASRGHASSVSTTESTRYGASARIPIPSSVSTGTSTGYQSSATSAAHSSSHKRTTSSATTSSQSQASPISASPPFSLAGTRPYQDNQRSLGPSHTREATAKPTVPLPSAVMKGYSAAEHTPKPRSNSKPLPDIAPPTTVSAATVGRLEGKSAAATAREVREAGMRRGSAGDSARTAVPTGTGSQSRRGGDLKIPARISMRQGSLKRELEAVKEFAASVDELKRLQTTHQSVVAALVPNPKRSSSRASNQPISPATLQSIETQYGIWWECAELLVDLGGAAPPTVAGTPIQENQPVYNGSSTSSAGHYGTQRSFSSSSSNNDLSSRQLELLKQMLSTPNPTSFSFANPSNPPHGAKDTLGGVKWPKGRSGAEFSGSGSDHVISDPPSSSTHGTKSSINSASSFHDHRQPPSSISRAQAPSTNYPYSQGTWTSKGRSSANAGGSRPNLSGLFSTDDQNQTPTGKPTTRGSSTSRGTLSGSSATGGLVTTDDAEEEVSDWDLESSDSGKARRNATAAKPPSSSTASSSLDISQLAHVQTRLALTPETILPLLAYAREVKARLVDCLEELERARAKARDNSATTANSTVQYSSRTSRAPEVGTSTLRRA